VRAAAYTLAPVGAFLLLLFPAQFAFSHMDAPRVSLSQLFLSADVVTIAHIERVAERRFTLNDKPTVKEVVSARVYAQYKGDALEYVDFFQDAHGHAHYVAGDMAVLFLDVLASDHRLSERGSAAGVGFVSRQVRNTEHRIQPTALGDYEWILSAYAALDAEDGFTVEHRTRLLKDILLRTLGSDSPDLVESGLLDWNHAGDGLELTKDEIAGLLALTHDPARPINLRLAILRTMHRKQLVDETAWLYLLRNETGDNLLATIRSTVGHESKSFTPYLVRLLDNPSETIVEAAARSLGHPVYAGAETALESLLDRQNQRLNYAAVYALVGLDSDSARQILLDAETNHPNPKVRRLISARLSTLAQAF
jgi:hypothetical protein